MFQDEESRSTHDSLLLLVSEIVGLERQMHRLQPAQVKRELRLLASSLTEFLPEVEELEELEGRIGRLEQRMKEMGIDQEGDHSDELDFI